MGGPRAGHVLRDDETAPCRLTMRTSVAVTNADPIMPARDNAIRTSRGTMPPPSDPDPCRREIDTVACPSCCVGSRRSTAGKQGSHHRPYTCAGRDRGQAVGEQDAALVDQPCGLRGHAETIEQSRSRASLPPENRTSNSTQESMENAPAGADCQEPLTAPGSTSAHWHLISIKSSSIRIGQHQQGTQCLRSGHSWMRVIGARDFHAFRLERSVGAGCLELPSGDASRMGH